MTGMLIPVNVTTPSRWLQLRRRVQRIIGLVHRIIGAPDYDAYVAHATRCHPDRPVQSRDDFVNERLTDKYSRPGTRCC